MTISNNAQTSYIQSTNNNSSAKKVSDSQEDSAGKYEFKNIPKNTLDAIYDDTNTFGMFLNKNDKAMKLLDEHILKIVSQKGISPQEAIPYVTNIAQTFKNDTVFAESLYKMVDNEEETSTEIGKLVEKFFAKLKVTHIKLLV